MDSSMTNTTTVADNQLISEREFNQSLGDLAKRWKTQNAGDLNIRHQVGELLNKHLGPPENRQKRGAEVVKKVAEQLEISVSEISRMRRFASRNPSFSDFQQHHPAATNWSAVKNLLPKVKRKPASNSRGPSPFSEAKRLLKTLSSTLAKVSQELKPAEKQALFERFQDVAEAVNDRLPLQVSVSQVSEPSAPATSTSAVEAS